MAKQHRRTSRPRARSRLSLGAALLVGVLVTASAVAAIQLIPSPFSEDRADAVEDTSTERPAAGGDRPDTYVEADVGFPETLNPLLAESSSEEAVAAMLYRGLTRIDGQGNPQPDLAHQWTVSDDGLEYTVELDPDATWHDGQPVTVDDVLFTISLIQEPDFPGDRSLSRFWRAITVRQAGEGTLHFTLLEPYSGFLHYLTLPVLPKHEFGGILPSDLEEPDLGWGEVGTGTYRLDELDEADREVRFTSRGAGESAPEFESVVFRYYDDREATLQAFREGEVDGLSYVPLNALDNGSLPSDSRVYASSMSGYTALYFNLRHPQFRDAQTRRAIEFAINRQEIIDTVLHGQAVTGSSPIPEMLSAHQPGEHAGFDPNRARLLLGEAGWQSGEDGTLQRDGEQFIVSLLVNGDDEQRLVVASQIQEQLRRVGISVEIHALPAGEVQRALASRQFGAALYGWHTENGDPDCYQMWHSSQAEEGMNFTGFSDTNADERLVRARHAVSVEERNEHYTEFQRIFADQVPAVVVYYPRYHFAVSARIDGVEPTPLVNPGHRVEQIPEWSFRERAGGGRDDQ